MPEEKNLITGGYKQCHELIEQPELIAKRICQFANHVGQERVIASSDCVFATFFGIVKVDPVITNEKFKAMVMGTELASRRLWGRS